MLWASVPIAAGVVLFACLWTGAGFGTTAWWVARQVVLTAAVAALFAGLGVGR